MDDYDRRRIDAEISRNGDTYASLAQRGWDAFKRFIMSVLKFISLQTAWEFFKTFVLGM